MTAVPSARNSGFDNISKCIDVSKLYSYWVPEEKIIKIGLWSAELSKLVIFLKSFLNLLWYSYYLLDLFC